MCLWDEEPCDRDTYARGLCQKHYMKARHVGSLDRFGLVNPALSHPKGQPKVPKPKRRRSKPVKAPDVSLRDQLDAMWAAHEAATAPKPCRRGCCWTPFGHAYTATDCTCHVRQAA